MIFETSTPEPDTPDDGGDGDDGGSGTEPE